MERDSFGQGYIAGWRSVQGDEEQPVILPAPAATGKSMYLVLEASDVRPNWRERAR
jgi:hypothetical protein